MNKTKIATALLLVCVLVAGACARKVVVSSANVGPSLVVEQFLRAANSNNYLRMGELFGTKDGSLASRDPKENVEQRMHTIASIVRHDDFEVLNDEIVAGRSSEATKLTVKITIKDKSYNVPFILVRAPQERWLIEQIGLEVITNARS